MLKKQKDKKEFFSIESQWNLNILSKLHLYSNQSQENNLIKKCHFSLSLPLFTRTLAVLLNKTACVMMFFHPTSPASIFYNLYFKDNFMPKQTIVELQVGEETTLIDESVRIKFLATHGASMARIAIDASNELRIYTEETRKKYLSEQNKKEEDK